MKAEDDKPHLDTPFFPEYSPFAVSQTTNLKAMNPQDSSSEVTPDGNTMDSREPESFSKWLMENSRKNIQNWEHLKKNLDSVRGVHRSVSPKKKGRVLKFL